MVPRRRRVSYDEHASSTRRSSSSGDDVPSTPRDDGPGRGTPTSSPGPDRVGRRHREPDRPRSRVSGGTDERPDPRERLGPRGSGHVREPVVRQPAGSPLRAGRGRLLRRRHRSGPVNPIPSYAPGAERGTVPVHVATSMDAPNPDSGEEHPHTNTQMYGTVSPEGNRFVPYEKMQPPYNAPDDPAREPTMDGFVADLRQHLLSETGAAELDEYSQIMRATPPSRCRSFGHRRSIATFDHWFCEAASRVPQPLVLPRGRPSAYL